MNEIETKTILDIRPSPKVNVCIKGDQIVITHYAINERIPSIVTDQEISLDIDSAREVAFAIAEYLATENTK